MCLVHPAADMPSLEHHLGDHFLAASFLHPAGYFFGKENYQGHNILGEDLSGNQLILWDCSPLEHLDDGYGLTLKFSPPVYISNTRFSAHGLLLGGFRT